MAAARKTAADQSTAPTDSAAPASEAAPPAAADTTTQPAAGQPQSPSETGTIAAPAETAAAEAAAEPEPEQPAGGGVAVTFQGYAATCVDGIGLVQPGEIRRVPEALANKLCLDGRELAPGETPLFVRAAP